MSKNNFLDNSVEFCLFLLKWRHFGDQLNASSIRIQTLLKELESLPQRWVAPQSSRFEEENAAVSGRYYTHRFDSDKNVILGATTLDEPNFDAIRLFSDILVFYKYPKWRILLVVLQFS